MHCTRSRCRARRAEEFSVLSLPDGKALEIRGRKDTLYHRRNIITLLVYVGVRYHHCDGIRLRLSIIVGLIPAV